MSRAKTQRKRAAKPAKKKNRSRPHLGQYYYNDAEDRMLNVLTDHAAQSGKRDASRSAVIRRLIANEYNRIKALKKSNKARASTAANGGAPTKKRAQAAAKPSRKPRAKPISKLKELITLATNGHSANDRQTTIEDRINAQSN